MISSQLFRSRNTDVGWNGGWQTPVTSLGSSNMKKECCVSTFCPPVIWRNPFPSPNSSRPKEYTKTSSLQRVDPPREVRGPTSRVGVVEGQHPWRRPQEVIGSISLRTSLVLTILPGNQKSSVKGVVVGPPFGPIGVFRPSHLTS